MFEYFIDNPSFEDVIACAKSYTGKEAPAIRKMYDYYNSKQKIKRRTAPEGRPCNNVVTNIARSMVDNTIGFMKFMEASSTFDTNEIEAIMKDTLITGVGYGLIEYDNSEKVLRRLPSTRAFVIKDTTLAHNPVMGVIINPYTTYDRGLAKEYMQLFVYDRAYVTEYKGIALETVEQVDKKAHMLPFMPLFEVRSSLHYEGLYDHAIDLMDSYNLIDSSYVDGRESFSESFLLVTGMSMSEDTADSLINAESKIINLPVSDADARYLTKDDTATEVIAMLENISGRIHSVCAVPDFDREGKYQVTSGKSNAFRALSFYNLVKSRENVFTSTLLQYIDPAFTWPEVTMFEEDEIEKPLTE